MELELEVSESQDYSEFPACDFEEVRLCFQLQEKSNNISCLYQCEKGGQNYTNYFKKSVEKTEKAELANLLRR